MTLVWRPPLQLLEGKVKRSTKRHQLNSLTTVRTAGREIVDLGPRRDVQRELRIDRLDKPQ